jgi:hypothetical protein
MSFLHKNNSEFLSARVTQKGRNSIAKGNFVISYFQIGDSEFDYTSPFTEFTGLNGKPHQSVFSPLDKENGIKYPYLLDNTTNVTTYGVPVQVSTTETLRNVMGPAGFVTNYKEYNQVDSTGTIIKSKTQLISLSGMTGTTSIIVPTGSSFNECEFITIYFSTFTGTDSTNPVISQNKSSLIYRIMNISGNTITLDRNLPNFFGCNGNAQVICNSCENEYPTDIIDPNCIPPDIETTQQLNPWTLNVVWDKKPIGFDTPSTDENLTGFTSNKFVSTKQFLGYTTSSGQTWVNMSGLTITGITSYHDSYNEKVIVTPEEQRCIAIIHYSELGDLKNDPERFFKYDDYISTNNLSNDAILEDEEENLITDLNYFEVYIPFIQYHRNSGTTIGALFNMDTVDYFVKSTKNASHLLKFRYLLDEQGYKVGKIFVNNKTIVIDDQELVAILDYKSNRKYTLPAPKVSLLPSNVSMNDSFFNGSISGQTIWVTYMFNHTENNFINGLPCNYYSKIKISPNDSVLNRPSQLYIDFDDNSFPFMKYNNSCNGIVEGFIANRFQVLIQITDIDELPSHDGWKIIDYTSLITNHTLGDLINPTNLTNNSIVINSSLYNNATPFDIETFLGNVPNEPSSLPQFGDEQPFPGSISLVRSTDIERMRFLVNLPSTQFNISQNPTYTNGSDKRITEIGLLNSNKEVLIIGKTSNPVKRSGTQVFSIDVDF